MVKYLCYFMADVCKQTVCADESERTRAYIGESSGTEVEHQLIDEGGKFEWACRQARQS